MVKLPIINASPSPAQQCMAFYTDPRAMASTLIHLSWNSAERFCCESPAMPRPRIAITSFVAGREVGRAAGIWLPFCGAPDERAIRAFYSGRKTARRAMEMTLDSKKRLATTWELRPRSFKLWTMREVSAARHGHLHIESRSGDPTLLLDMLRCVGAVCPHGELMYVTMWLSPGTESTEAAERLRMVVFREGEERVAAGFLDLGRRRNPIQLGICGGRWEKMLARPPSNSGLG